MKDITENYTYFLHLYFRTMKDPCTFKIRKKESERFKLNLESHNKNNSLASFFIGDTIEGKCIGINLSLIQTIRLLWEPSTLPEDEERYEGPIKIFLLNRESPILTDTENPEILFDFYRSLEHGPETVGKFVTFIDIDGEEVIINIEELIYIECPKSLTDAGWQMVKSQH